MSLRRPEKSSCFLMVLKHCLCPRTEPRKLLFTDTGEAGFGSLIAEYSPHGGGAGLGHHLAFVILSSLEASH